MHEYRSDAVVLDAAPAGESDTRFFLYTERYGRIVARAKSARKITSKLTPHLQAGDFAAVRIVEKNGLRMADALKSRRLPHAPGNLAALNRLLHDGERDAGLWALVTAATYDWRSVLARLGWDPARASCTRCKKNVSVFIIHSQEFVCPVHASKLPAGEVVSVG